MRKFEISQKAREVVLKDVIKSAREAVKNSYAPYSGCHVGCALVSALTGCVYSGCNVENSSYGATICAERNAISNAVAKEGDIAIAILVVLTDRDEYFEPCGICLQTISEFADDNTQIVLLNKNDESPRFYDFSELMPHSFKL